MIKNIILLVIFLLIGWVIYVQFFGDTKDIELRNKLLNTGKDFGKSVVDIFKNESTKIQRGKYNEVFDKLGEAIKSLKKADAAKNEHSTEIERLSEEKDRLEKLIAENKNIESNGLDPNSENNQKLKKLAEDIIALTNKMEQK